MKRTPEIHICSSLSKKMLEFTYAFDRIHQMFGDTASGNDEILVPQIKTIFSQAATIIQRAWRAHVDFAVFKHLKKLVSFHNLGDPCLLRFINPAEANILDAASGVLIRFKLGGTAFPPNTYYKIYTRAPIVDMCASSPKDYTHALLKKPVPSQIHNGQQMIYDDQSGWYQWVENNGWRISSCKNYYIEGLLFVSTEHRETALLEEKSAQRMINSLEQIGPNPVSEQEVHELLALTNAFNFDEYASEWRDLGTSNCWIFNKDEMPVLDTCEFPQMTVKW